MSYPDSIMSKELYSASPSGTLDWAFRAYIYDAETFVGDDPNLLVIDERGMDADMSAGVHYFDNIQIADGSFKSYIVGYSKGSMILVIDVSGVNSAVTFDHTNPLAKGIVPTEIYGGPDGTLGGANYGSANSAGKFLLAANANASPVPFNAAFITGSRSTTYTNNFNQGFEFHVTQGGEILQIQNSVAQAIDISKQQIAWETPLGQRSHSIMTGTNGVIFGINGDGVLFGFDMESGKTLWKLNTAALGCAGGITCPIFCGDKAYVIPEYSAAGGLVGGVGPNGLVLTLNVENLPKTDDTAVEIFNNNVYTSYDVNPKASGVDVFAKLVIDDVVTHTWTGSSVLASHTITGTSATFTAGPFNFSNNTLLFESPTVQNDLKYLSIEVFNTGTYLLNYQYFDGSVWVSKTATLGN